MCEYIVKPTPDGSILLRRKRWLLKSKFLLKRPFPLLYGGFFIFGSAISPYLLSVAINRFCQHFITLAFIAHTLNKQ